jgi:hypothetical protein
MVSNPLYALIPYSSSGTPAGHSSLIHWSDGKQLTEGFDLDASEGSGCSGLSKPTSRKNSGLPDYCVPPSCP